MTAASSTQGGGELRPHLEAAVLKFNERAKSDVKFQETLKDMTRWIQLDVAGDQTYHFHLKDYAIDGVRDGPCQDPEVVVTSDKATMLGIFAGEVSPMRAYMGKKIRFKATLTDLLVLRKLF